MLAITIREGKSFTIGDEIVIMVVKIYNDQRVKVSIEAPRALAICREDAKIKYRKPEKGKE